MSVRTRHVHFGSRDIEYTHLPCGDVLRATNSYQHDLTSKFSQAGERGLFERPNTQCPHAPRTIGNGNPSTATKGTLITAAVDQPPCTARCAPSGAAH